MHSKAILFFVLCLFYLNGCVGRNVRVWLESPKLTNWGDWGEAQLCQENQFVIGLNLKIEGAQGERVAHKDDDTALNAVRLTCANLDGSNTYPLYAKEGPWGDFRGDRRCRNGVATGFTLRSEPDRRGKDDTAAVDMKLRCTNYDGTVTQMIGGDILEYGRWTDEQRCPPMTAICGINTQVEEDQGHNGDDTSLNNVNIACCNIPSPYETCAESVDIIWRTELHCHQQLGCSVEFTTGVSRTQETSNAISESTRFYKELGFNVGLEGTYNGIKGALQINGKFGNERVNGKTITEIIRETSYEEKKVRINICVGALQKLVIRCGILEISTPEYRCVPDN